MQQDELSRLAPENRMIVVGNETVEIHPLYVEELPRVLRAMKVLWPLIEANMSLIDIIEQHFADVVEIVGAAISKPTAWVMKLTLAKLLDVLMAVKEMNVDFFSHPLLIALSRDRLVQALNQTLAADGSNVSSDLSALATEKPT